MKNILRYLKPYWYDVLLVVALLVVQAYCDLSLPDYTSNLIDVGISNSGIESPIPSTVSEAGYAAVRAFLTEEEAKDWDSAYSHDEGAGVYELSPMDDEEMEAFEDEFAKPVAIAYMASEAAKGGEAGASAPAADSGDLGAAASAPAGDAASAPAGTGDPGAAGASAPAGADAPAANAAMLQQARAAMEEKLSTLGDSMIRTMAKQFVRDEYEACGIDLEKMQSDYLWSTGAKMMGMAAVMALVAVLVGYLAARAGAGVGRDLRGKVFYKVTGFSSAELDRFSTASLITRSTNDVQQIQMVVVVLLRMVLYAPILAIGGIINIRNYHSGMSWVIVLAVVLVFCVIMVLMAITMPKFQKMQDMVDRVNLIAREILTGLPVIRAFSREKWEEDRFDEANRDLTRVMLFTNRAMSFMMPVLMLIMNGISVLIIWVASKKIDTGMLEVGAMTAFITYAMLIIMGFLMITMVSIMLPRAAVAADRIQEVLDTEETIVNREGAREAAPADMGVKFDHVSFRYPGGAENVLTDISFEARPGETTAIIGSTGCGKSTLLKLIPRFYDVTEGTVQVGGADVRDYDIRTLRAAMGYVPQKAVLFSGDVASNISYGAPGATQRQIEDAARIAQAEEFIGQKADGYHSAIAQGGSNVSGGQKQRLAIARAIAREPGIYLFDDSFSALDFKTDTALRKALSEKTADATVIIVAQRVSTILSADQILVIENGRLVGKGTHRELVASCEEYRQIAQSQLSESEFRESIAGKGGMQNA